MAQSLQDRVGQGEVTDQSMGTIDVCAVEAIQFFPKKPRAERCAAGFDAVPRDLAGDH